MKTAWSALTGLFLLIGSKYRGPIRKAGSALKKLW